VKIHIRLHLVVGPSVLRRVNVALERTIQLCGELFLRCDARRPRDNNRKPQRKTIQPLFDGHVSLAQRQTVASFSAPRVTK
jgi:hypothetical protein